MYYIDVVYRGHCDIWYTKWDIRDSHYLHRGGYGTVVLFDGSQTLGVF